MLYELHVHDIALIEDAYLELSEGLTVLTGETGAGKTALLSALRLVTGQRGDAKSVRDGSDEALAEATFSVDGQEHVVKRRLSSQGRSRCFVDGEMASVGELAQQLSFVHIHNQHEQVLLLQPATQLDFLDRFIDPECRHLETYRDALKAFRSAALHCKELEDSSASRKQELEYLRFVNSQISQVNPQQGEYERLEEELPRLQNAESLARAVETALDALHSDGAALDLLAEASQSLSRMASVDEELEDLSQRLDALQDSLSDLTRDLQSYGASISHDPEALQDHLNRLDALSGLMKRYGPGMAQVLATWEDAKKAEEGVASSPQAIAKARKERNLALERLKAEGLSLQAKRKDAAARLCALLAESVSELAMPDASFEFSFTLLNGAKWTDRGPASVELLFCPASGATPRPLRQIASGGELSRILLALECVLRETVGASSDETLVFDEVDAGIGGSTGEAVGKRLAQLARHAQVVVVTHLPQVASQADTHFVVSKEERPSQLPATSVRKVTGEERVSELARMLAGGEDAVAMEHARSLLERSAK